MIDEIDSKLSQINNDNQYTDTNLVQKNLFKIVKREKTSFGFLKKNYFILIFCLIITKTTFESSLLLTPLIGWFNKPEKYHDVKHSFLMFAALLLVIISTLISKFLLRSKIINEKKVLYWIYFILLMNLILCVFTWKIPEAMWLGFFLTVLLSCISEALISNLLNKVVPVYFKLLCIHSEYVISAVSAFSKIISGLLIFLFCFQTVEGEKIIFSIFFFFTLISLILLLLWNRNIKVKAITKLIKQRKEFRDSLSR